MNFPDLYSLNYHYINVTSILSEICMFKNKGEKKGFIFTTSELSLIWMWYMSKEKYVHRKKLLFHFMCHRSFYLAYILRYDQ